LTDERVVPSETHETDERKRIARSWYEDVINGRNLDAIADIYAPDYVHHGPEGSEMHGIEAVRELATAILAAFADRHADVIQQVAEGNLVATRFISRGHHTSVFRGHQPSGRIWTTEGIHISRIRDGRVAEDWEVSHHSGIEDEAGGGDDRT
jgi:predicted ester cyclase